MSSPSHRSSSKSDDVDFPEVWRAAAGLDGIAQAAGRCNLEGKLDIGRTVVFTPQDVKPPHEVAAFWQAARPALGKHDDVLGLDAIGDYFHELYWQKGEAALDATDIEGRAGVLPALAERAKDLTFRFRAIAQNFRLIDDVMEPVIVPWDEDAKTLLIIIRKAEPPSAGHLRRLQQYTVSIPKKARDSWLSLGALKAVHPALGDGLLAFDNLRHYRPKTGLDLTNMVLWPAEDGHF